MYPIACPVLEKNAKGLLSNTGAFGGLVSNR